MTTRKGSRSLNKPLLLCGLDRKLAGMAMIMAVIVGQNDGWTAKLSALALFISLCAAGRTMTRKDPNAFAVLSKAWRRKSLYEPMKGGA